MDLINPVWNLRAKGAFLQPELANLTSSQVVFNLILLKSGERIGRYNRPFHVPIASSDFNQTIVVPRVEVSYSFILSGSSLEDPDFNQDFIQHIYDRDTSYQLEAQTNEEDAVPITVSVSAVSDLSLKGIIMAGIVLIFLYVLIIFEIVHRTLAAMLGATAAIACLTIIHDVSLLTVRAITHILTT